ncbi:hypothetical protein RF11_06765 [Thelohanellus kitauei]|uniref:Uncharacterized protein n=1 Tax=Thelohanellus kitauei TaxID=669202 RepID=A0A0C2MM74_THEKT|nr:hypothetical protein RF11_06765 [Thelohanellus kitauei]
MVYEDEFCLTHKYSRFTNFKHAFSNLDPDRSTSSKNESRQVKSNQRTRNGRRLVTVSREINNIGVPRKPSRKSRKIQQNLDHLMEIASSYDTMEVEPVLHTPTTFSILLHNTNSYEKWLEFIEFDEDKQHLILKGCAILWK